MHKVDRAECVVKNGNHVPCENGLLSHQLCLRPRLARASPSRATDSGLGATRPTDSILHWESLCGGQQLHRLSCRRTEQLILEIVRYMDDNDCMMLNFKSSLASMTAIVKVIEGGEKHSTRFAFCPSYDFICWAIIGWVAQHMVKKVAKSRYF